jgi:RNA-directed DNA polymerase
MKRHGNLWDKITSLDNIKLAHAVARRGKAFYTEVKMVDADVEKYAKEVQTMLLNKTFTTSPYEVEDRFDGRKMRTIYKLPYYPDRIVQHAMLNIVGPDTGQHFYQGYIPVYTGPWHTRCSKAG